MAPKAQIPETSPSAQAPAKAPEIVSLLGKVERLLHEGSPGKAIEEIVRAKLSSPWATNAVGVCQLRLGNPSVAVDVFRGLVVGTGGFLLREDVPIVFKTNFATALLVSDNVPGCLRVLEELRNEQAPAVQRLRDAIARWEKSLTFWHKVQWYVGGHPNRPVSLDFPLGEVE